MSYGQVMNMVVAVLVHVVSSVATLQQKNQHNGQGLRQVLQKPLRCSHTPSAFRHCPTDVNRGVIRERLLGG